MKEKLEYEEPIQSWKLTIYKKYFNMKRYFKDSGEILNGIHKILLPYLKKKYQE